MMKTEREKERETIVVIERLMNIFVTKSKLIQICYLGSINLKIKFYPSFGKFKAINLKGKI